MMAKRKKRYFTKAERFLYKLCFSFVILLVVGIIFGQSTLSKINFEVEKLKEEVLEKENNNQSLTMIINEMVSLENIQSIASDMGLAYNNENIKIVSE